ncbi:MAG: hypothetical protein DRI46_09280 [Chloroflexi bacterium]|nr:MAG: hypothetical protein DRI46_09280 [Chloroflexota bacterium]
MTNDRLLWWAYLHTDTRTIQVKRFFDHRDIAEARESSFVGQVIGPFEAKDRDAALAKARNSLK